MVGNSDEVKVDAILELGVVGEVVSVEVRIEPPAELPHSLTLLAPKTVTVPPREVTVPPAEVAQPPRPKRRWWQIFP